MFITSFIEQIQRYILHVINKLNIRFCQFYLFVRGGIAEIYRNSKRYDIQQYP